MDISIPPELLDIIFGHLDEIGHLLACTKTCRRWYLSAIGALYRLDSITGSCYALFTALNNDNRDTLHRILHLRCSYDYPFNYNHLSLAIIKGHNDIAEAMLQSPTLLSQWRSQTYGTDEYGRTPLVAAVLTRNIHLVRLILGITTVQSDRLFCYSALDITVLSAACMGGAIDRGRIIQRYKDNRRIYCRPRLKWPFVAEEEEKEARDVINMDIFNLLINAGASIDCRRWAYTSPLHCAVKYNNQYLIQFLLDRGANINREIERGITPLIVAIRMRSMTMIKLLIGHGADWTRPLHTGGLLHLTDNVEIAQYFIQLGVPVTPLISYERSPQMASLETPLMNACQCGYPEMAKFLLQQGADPFVTNSWGHTTLYAAASRDMADVVEILHQRGVSIEQSVIGQRAGRQSGFRHLPTKELLSPLHRAASLGHVATVEKLLQLGARTVRNPEKFGILCLVDKEDIVKLLIQYGGTDLDETSNSGNTASHYLAGHKFEPRYIKMLKLYGRLGANLNLWNEAGDTALHVAVTNQNHDAITALIEAGADPNRLNRSGLTPLMAASLSKGLHVVKILLGNGANIHAQSHQLPPMQRTALRFACNKNRNDIIMELLKAGGDLNDVWRFGSNRARDIVKRDYCNEDV